MAASRTKVLLEIGTSKAFAVALDWPGWARPGKKTSEAALEALEAYAPRYGEVAKRAGVALPAKLTYSVVEKVSGSARRTSGSRTRWLRQTCADGPRAEAERQISIMGAAWDYLDDVGAAATPKLARGPRGGGRDPVLQHVLSAEAIEAMRADFVDVLSQPSSGVRIGGEKGWPARYAVRRIGWHVLDHAWEIQDKSG